MEERPLNLEPAATNMVALILAANALGSIIYLTGGFLVGGQAALAPRDILFVVADLYFAYYLFKRRPWARTWVVVRSIVGCVIWVVVSLYQKDVFGALTQVIFFGAILAVLSGKVPLRPARVLSALAIGLICVISFQNISAVVVQKRLMQQIASTARTSYESKPFGYRIRVPAGWNIIHRSEFGVVEKSLLKTDAEIGIINSEGNGYCLLIPERLEGYGKDYVLEGLHTAVMDNIKRVSGVQLGEDKLVSPYGDAGFEITYSLWDKGFHYQYMVLYTVYQKVGIQLLAWALDSHAGKVFADVKSFAGQVELAAP